MPRLTLPNVMHPNGHSKEFWFGPDMSIELYLLVKALSIKGWNWMEIVFISTLSSHNHLSNALSLEKERVPWGKPSTPLRTASNEARNVTVFEPVSPNTGNHSGPCGQELPWTTKLIKVYPRGLTSKGLSVLLVGHVLPPAPIWAHPGFPVLLTLHWAKMLMIFCSTMPETHCAEAHLIYINCLQVAEVPRAQHIMCKVTSEASKVAFQNPKSLLFIHN